MGPLSWSLTQIQVVPQKAKEKRALTKSMSRIERESTVLPGRRAAAVWRIARTHRNEGMSYKFNKSL